LRATLGGGISLKKKRRGKRMRISAWQVATVDSLGKSEFSTRDPKIAGEGRGQGRLTLSKMG